MNIRPTYDNLNWIWRFFPIGTTYGNKYRSRFTLSGSYIPLKSNGGSGNPHTKNKRQKRNKIVAKIAAKSRRTTLYNH
jgi:hypothetical protein